MGTLAARLAAGPALGVILAVPLAGAACTGVPSGPESSGPRPVTPAGTMTTGAAVDCVTPPPPPTSVPTFTAAPDPSHAGGARWRAVLTTTCGVVTLELDGATAPASVASFLTLARSGYWRDSVCHRLTSRTASTTFLQCGDVTGHSLGNPGYGLPAEHLPADGRYPRGTVAMARGPGVASTSGEFLLVYADFVVPPGDPVYPVIGRIVGGLAVVDHIARAGGEDTRPDGPPFRSISIRQVTVHAP